VPVLLRPGPAARAGGRHEPQARPGTAGAREQWLVTRERTPSPTLAAVPAELVEWVRSHDGRRCLCVVHHVAGMEDLFQGAKTAAIALLEYTGKIKEHFCEPAGGQAGWPEVVAEGGHVRLQNGPFVGLAAVGCANQKDNRERAACLALILTAAVAYDKVSWSEQHVSWPQELPRVVRAAAERYAQQGVQALQPFVPGLDLPPAQIEEVPDAVGAGAGEDGMAGEDYQRLCAELQQLQAERRELRGLVARSRAEEARASRSEEAAQEQVACMRQRNQVLRMKRRQMRKEVQAEAQAAVTLRDELQAATRQCRAEASAEATEAEVAARCVKTEQSEALAALKFRSEHLKACALRRQETKFLEERAAELEAALQRSEATAADATARREAASSARARAEAARTQAEDERARAEAERDDARAGISAVEVERKAAEDTAAWLRQEILRERTHWQEELSSERQQFGRLLTEAANEIPFVDSQEWALDDEAEVKELTECKQEDLGEEEDMVEAEGEEMGTDLREQAEEEGGGGDHARSERTLVSQRRAGVRGSVAAVLLPNNGLTQRCKPPSAHRSYAPPASPGRPCNALRCKDTQTAAKAFGR